ncbi:hypothetical protein [Aestuariivirga litoralis]|uniref:hypothetical protein n=1 Tax=Aestuariivirga litoralis TaxID=2650924 RepID=UPI0018C6FA11|nr:hypothetical protein [Aestuariivirga litoralis]MBG1233186.1 hypothetical protein [Aestuariivirga litoralis]
MITLSEWSRRRPPQPAFDGFGFDGGFQADESGVEEFDALLGGLLDNIEASVRRDVAAGVDARCASVAASVTQDIDEKISHFAARMSADLTGQFNAVLKPWMGKQIETVAIESFCQAVASALGDELSQDVAVQVPKALQARLEAAFQREGIKAKVSPSPDAELYAKVRSTSVSTEISVWQAKLNSVLP